MSRRNRTRANQQIRANKVRVIDPDGENLGVMKFDDALEKARDHQLDLVEISPQANPSVCRIMDFGKYKYEQQKKRQRQKANSTQTETKVVQVKIGTGEHDLELKAKRASGWLEEGHRVKVELYLRGRAKGLGRDFHEERLERFLKYFTADYEVAQDIKKGPKGLYMVLESK